MGGKPKPLEQKKRLGNPGHQKLPKQVAEVVSLPVQNAPEPHRPLGQQGHDLWDRVWRSCAAWLKVESDAEQVLLVCEMTDERVRLRYQVLNDPNAWRERRALRDLEKSIQSALGSLGMTPVDRARLGVSEVKENPLAKLHAEVAARRAAAQR